MKYLFCDIILTLFCTANFASAQTYGWVDISNNVPVDVADISDVYFITDNEGWITSSSHAEIYHTTDGGENWEIQTTQLATEAIWILDENEGYAGGYSGYVYRTTDGGANWNFHGLIGATLLDIVFPPQPADTGYACGFNGAISYITSSGVIPMNSGVPDHLSAITFPIAYEGWVCGGSIIKHYIGGNWVADQDPPSGGYNAIYMVDNQNGWAAGDAGIIIHTTDGQNWFEQTNPDILERTLRDVFFLSLNEGWAVGTGLILHTTDGGTEWVIEADGLTSNCLRGVRFTSSTNGYICGNNKTLLKYTQLGVEERNLTSPKPYFLSQNSPNPFRQMTEIRIQMTENRGQKASDREQMSLKIFDLSGRLVKNFPISNFQFPIRLSWDGRNNAGERVTSGVYFLRMETEYYRETRQLLLIK